jgi:tetratricopeptide (TPR) repeat protein
MNTRYSLFKTAKIIMLKSPGFIRNKSTFPRSHAMRKIDQLLTQQIQSQAYLDSNLLTLFHDGVNLSEKNPFQSLKYFNQIISSIEKSLKHLSDNQKNILIRAYINKAIIYSGTRKDEDILSLLDKALAISPENDLANELKKSLLESREKKAEVLSSFRTPPPYSP